MTATPYTTQRVQQEKSQQKRDFLSMTPKVAHILLFLEVNNWLESSLKGPKRQRARKRIKNIHNFANYTTSV
jgi:hypothetical protein